MVAIRKFSGELTDWGCLTGFEAYSFSTPFARCSLRSAPHAQGLRIPYARRVGALLRHPLKNPHSRILFVGAVVEEVRTIFEKRNDATIYIPDMQSIAVLG